MNLRPTSMEVLLCSLLLCLIGFTQGQTNIGNVTAGDLELAQLKTKLKKLSSMDRQLNDLQQQVQDMSSSRRIVRRDASILVRPRDCADIMAGGASVSGEYTVYVGSTLRPVRVYCDMKTDGGGWLVFQRRQDGSVNFQRSWTDYANGFGNIQGEFWLGNSALHSLTAWKQYNLRIDLGDWNGALRYAEYTNFKVASAGENYALLSVGSYFGNAGDSLTDHLGQKFSTADRDNDARQTENCAAIFKGAWWYRSCHYSNLNGAYLRGIHTSYADGVEWYHWTGYYYSLKFTEMKIRPSDV